MPQPKPRVLIENILLGLAVVSLIIGFGALVFPEEVTRENRALLIIAGSLGLFASLLGLVSGFLYLALFAETHQSEGVVHLAEKHYRRVACPDR